MVFGLLDPNQNPLVRGMDPDPYADPYPYPYPYVIK
jgi:hypothetical protein